MSNIFFISDLHLGHASALKWARKWRQGETIDEHDQILIDKINSVVRPRDRLYILGDVSWKENKLFMLDQINAKELYLVRGNHDDLPTDESRLYFKEIYGIYKKYNMWMTHAPIHPDELRGCVNIHGHVHENSIRDGQGWVDKRYINVGVEALDGVPISLDEIRNGDYWKRKIV